ncbi:MAG TPA: PIG-L family deacetylase, partial [Anaerolineaceae bacterium]|nr:PIG-L family deacetylase [Anaerolineaceae bacterium]
MTTIFLSPHFDDAVYSCGGWIWDRTQAGDPVEVWTVCAGNIPPGPLSPLAEMLHERWGTGGAAISVRRAEDQRACQIVGAKHRHLDIPDVIYRRLPDGQPVAQSEEGLSGPLPLEERERAAQIAAQLKSEIPDGALLVSPIGLGHHI